MTLSFEIEGRLIFLQHFFNMVENIKVVVGTSVIFYISRRLFIFYIIIHKWVSLSSRLCENIGDYCHGLFFLSIIFELKKLPGNFVGISAE